MRYLLLLCLFATTALHAQSDMRVYTVAGVPTSGPLGDGGPATAAALGNTEGVWMDGFRNLYISTLDGRIRKVTPSGIITTITGDGTTGYSGDGGPATLAKLNKPYGLYADSIGNVLFADMGNNRIRRVDAGSGVISTIAGNGISGFNGDGGAATNAELHNPCNVYLDSVGNIYIGEQWKIRKVDANTGIITTLAGTGSIGMSGDGGPATAAQIRTASGMVFDKHNNFYFADRGNSRIRKINASGVISTIAGTSVGYSGDGGPAVNAQLSNPISIALDSFDNLIIGDNGNNVIRKVNAVTGIITTIAGDTSLHATALEGALAMNTQMHPEFIYIDSGNIYYSTYWTAQVRKIENFKSESPNSNASLSLYETIGIYPNPASQFLQIDNIQANVHYTLLSIVGTILQQGQLDAGSNTISLAGLPAGIYLLHLDDNNQRTVHKILKQ